MSLKAFDFGPVADQLNIAAAGAAVADISVTIQPGRGGPILAIGLANFSGGGVGTTYSLRIQKNGADLTPAGTGTSQAYVALGASQVITAQAIDVVPGDILTLFALTSASDGDILAGRAQLAVIGLPKLTTLAAQPANT